MTNLVYPKPNHVINFVVLVTKQYVLNVNVKQTPCTLELEYEIDLSHNIEYFNAIKAMRLFKYISKWSPIKLHLNELLEGSNN